MGSISIHLLSEKFISEKDVAFIIEKTAREMQLRLLKKNDNYDGDYYVVINDNIINDSGYGNQLDIFPNDYQEYQESIDGLFYPNTSFGRNIVIGHYSGDEFLIPFLKEFLSHLPEIKIYAEDGLPIGVKYRLYSKIDFDKATTTDIFTFFENPPIDNDNVIV